MTRDEAVLIAAAFATATFIYCALVIIHGYETAHLIAAAKYSDNRVSDIHTVIIWAAFAVVYMAAGASLILAYVCTILYKTVSLSNRATRSYCQLHDDAEHGSAVPDWYLETQRSSSSIEEGDSADDEAHIKTQGKHFGKHDMSSICSYSSEKVGF